MNGKKSSSMYVAYLKISGYGIADFIERFDLLQGIDAYEELVREAQIHKYGDGIYEVILVREHFDEKGRFVKSGMLRRFVTRWGDEL